MAEAVQDRWAAWLLRRRHGDDPDGLKQTLERLAPVRDRVLANGAIAPGETLIDVGCGDGLIAFGALDRVGEQGTVIFSDISSDLLEHDRRLVEQLGLVDRCRFVQAAADDLSAIADGAVDFVTTRSVLAYVKRKREAIAEFARVLRPGGRISLYEPVNCHIYAEPTGSFFGYDVGAVEDLASRVNAAYEARQSLVDDPMFDYDERDLLGYVEDAGFRARHLELQMHVERAAPTSWERFAGSAPNPLAPTLMEAISETLSATEQGRFVAHLRPLVEQGDGERASAVVYLWASK
jgi:ubiquinone/menaquinone biosynthesis C-methylase UbiE